MKDFSHIKKLLAGEWKGRGFAQYPTIQPAPYEEEYIVTTFGELEVLKYEQRSWYLDEQENRAGIVFWETGMWVFKEEKMLLLAAQFSGRMESLVLKKLDEENGEWKFQFESETIGNDPGLVKSIRTYTLADGVLSYELGMEMVKHPQLDNHLKATLKKTTP